MEIIRGIEQRSPEWFNLRKLKMTASEAQAISACGKGLETYITELCCNYFSNAEEERYTNKDMQRGIELEAEAKNLYELETGNKIEQVAFVIYNEFVGCSPDGLVGNDGLVEIKCHNNIKHFKMLLGEPIESGYIWQMQMQMLICERLWCDYVAYNPNFKDLFIIKRIERDIEMQQKLLRGFERGKELIKLITNRIGG